MAPTETPNKCHAETRADVSCRQVPCRILPFVLQELEINTFCEQDCVTGSCFQISSSPLQDPVSGTCCKNSTATSPFQECVSGSCFRSWRNLIDSQLATACRQMPPGVTELERAKIIILRIAGRFAVFLQMHLDEASVDATQSTLAT